MDLKNPLPVRVHDPREMLPTVCLYTKLSAPTAYSIAINSNRQHVSWTFQSPRRGRSHCTKSLLVDL